MNDTVRRELTKAGGFAEDLSSLRHAAGLTGRQLAEQLGWSPDLVSRMETGKRLFTEDRVREYLVACAASPADQERVLGKLSEVRRIYPDLERKRKIAKRHSSYIESADLPPTGPLRNAYRQGYARAIRDIQNHLNDMTRISPDET